MSAHVLSPIFFLAFRGLTILGNSKAIGVRAMEVQADILEFSPVSPSVSDEILGMSEHFCTDKQNPSIYTTCGTRLRQKPFKWQSS